MQAVNGPAEGVSRMQQEASTSAHRPFLMALVALMLVGLAIRLDGLTTMSVDLEEYACTGALDAPNVIQFLIDQRALYPYGAPLVPLMFYLWSGIAGDSITAIRLFVLPFGLALIPILYWAGCVLYAGERGRWGGLTAAVLATLSPVQFVHAQEARMYAFVSLFAAISCVSLLLANRSNATLWWRINLAMNALLLWSHLFGVLLIATQGAWLLFVVRPGMKRVARWTGLHALLVVPLLLWALTIPYAGAPLYEYYAPPGMKPILLDLFSDDVVRWSSLAYWHLPPTQNAWFGSFLSLRAFLDPLTLTLFAGIFALYVARLAKCMLRNMCSVEVRESLLVLAWFLAPISALVVASYIGQPVYASRYSAHSQLAFYLMVGTLLATLPIRMLRVGALSFVMLLMSYQIALALSAPIRTEWREALALADAAPLTAPLLVEDPFWLQVVEVNREESDRIVVAAFQRDTLAEAAALCVDSQASPSAQVSVLLVDIRGEGADAFAERLKALGLTAEHRSFHGERPLHLFSVQREQMHEPEPCAQGAAADALLAQVDTDEVQQLRERVTFEPDERAGVYIRLAFAYLDRKDPASACHALDKAVAVWPDFAGVFSELAEAQRSGHE